MIQDNNFSDAAMSPISPTLRSPMSGFISPGNQMMIRIDKKHKRLGSNPF